MHGYTMVENTSKKYFSESRWNSSKSGMFTIIGKTNRTNGKNSYIYCLCEFDDGGVVEADFTNISKGNVRNPFRKSIYGVGYMGQGKWVSKINKKTTIEYATWIKMMHRCYSDRDCKKDVTVDERWHNFQNFCEDIQKLQGYYMWKRDSSNYEISKAISCEKSNLPNIYSKDNCIFMPISEDITGKNLTGITYIGTSPEGKEYSFKNQSAFSKKHGLNRSLINACIHGKRKRHREWIFKIKS